MTIVNGKLVSKDGNLISMNADEIGKTAHKIAKNIVSNERLHKG